MELEYLNCNFDESSKYSEVLLEKAKTNIEKGEIYFLLIHQKVSQLKFTESLQIGI